MDKVNIIIEQVTEYSGELRDAIEKLAMQEGKNYKELTPDDLKSMLDSPHTTLLVARDLDTNVLVGMVTLVVYRIPYAKKAYLDDLVVDEAYRGKGIGTLLLERVASLAQEKGAAYLDFTSRIRRESNGLYTKLGFQVRETNVYRLIFDYGEL